MKAVLVFFLLILPIARAAAQQNKFQLPAGADFMPGKIRAKVKAEFKSEFLSRSSARIKNLPFTAIAPMVKQALSKKGAAWRGPLAAKPRIDIASYFEISFDRSLNIESYINQLYQTGFFEIIEPVYSAHINFIPNDPDSSKQYYLKTIRAFEAWNITQGSEDITIAIVDTGGDLDHPDLAGNLYVNTKEIPANGADDDQDGFIDNYRGWDFVGADTLNAADPNFEGDNDPSIFSGGVNSHGTWVAGCASASTDNGIGMSGIGFKTKLMFTKHSADNENTSKGTIYSGFSGILYAANQGIKIINCSWGGYYSSQIEQDLINHITLDLGCLIVAAAGNTRGSPMYPASYDNVLSVTATDQNNQAASFAYIGETVDLAAPGVAIYTTGFNDVYSVVSGTSFSSPITAGAAALVWAEHPLYSGSQIAELLKASSNHDLLYSKNPSYGTFLGSGLLDIQQALTRKLPLLRASNIKLLNSSGGPPLAGEQGFLTMDITNYLDPTSADLKISAGSDQIPVSTNIISPGVIKTNQTVSTISMPFSVSLNPNVVPYTPVEVAVYYSDAGYQDLEAFDFEVNLTPFDVINVNQVTTSLGGTGRIGFENSGFGGDSSGDGFIFRQQQLVSEIGIMMGTSDSGLFNNVRGKKASVADHDFFPIASIQEIFPGVRSDEEIFGSFSNAEAPSNQTLAIGYRSLVWKNAPADKFVMFEFKVTNTTTTPLHNFYFGMFVDWDITSFNDYADWYGQEKIGYIYPANNSGGLYAGTQLLTGSPLYYAIDNNPYIPGLNVPTDAPFAINDGFTDAEKFLTLSSQRLTGGMKSPVGSDVSHVVSSGPYVIKPGQTITLAFALHAAEDLPSLKSSAVAADSLYNQVLYHLPEEPIAVFPNPVQDGPIKVVVNEKSGTPVDLSMSNLMGVLLLQSSFETSDEINNAQIEMNTFPAGIYILRIKAGERTFVRKIIKQQ